MSEFVSNALGKRAKTLDISPQFSGYSGVEIVVDDNTTFFSGSDVGRILTINNPWGSQEQADNIISAIRGFQYQPYTATGALLSPAAELGDAVTINGVYSGVFAIDKTFSTLMASDIKAPQDEEIDHEYPYEPQVDRVFNRAIAETRSQIAVTATAIQAEVARATEAEGALQSALTLQASEISAKVSQSGGNNSSFGWTLTAGGFYLYSGGTNVMKATSDGLEVSGKISSDSGQIGGFNITASSIYNGVETLYDTTHNGVYVGTDGISCGKGAFRATASGDISANNMTLTGTLTVGGRTITAAQLQSGAYSAYANGGAWTSGSNWGTAFGTASTRGGAHQNYFRADYINCDAIYLMDNMWGLSSTGVVYGDKSYIPKTKTVVTGISGQSRVYDVYGNEQYVVRSLSTTTLYYLGRNDM